jgi:oligosaccharide repeat unit polymerase
MKLTLYNVLLGLIIGLTACMSAFLSILQETDLALAFYAIAAILLIFLGRSITGNYSNFTIIFIIFSALYSLSGPIAARYGDGIPEFYPTPYLFDEFFLHYSLAVIGLTLGLMFVAALKSPGISVTRLAPAWNSKTLLKLSYAFAVTASFGEIVNFIRVGGFTAIYAGKAAYHSAVSELPGTLPSTLIILLSIALLALSLSVSNMSRKRWARSVIMWIISSLPLILSLLVIGDRATLLSIIVIFIVGHIFFSPIKRIEVKWVAFGVFIYFMMAFLYGVRSHFGLILTTGELKILMTLISEPTFWINILNPASNDFHCAFGNFNTYILSGTSDLRLGESYLKGLTMPIPRFIWPDKPQSIGYDFRDTFFPDWAQQGISAGTAYSSLLEAYLNFGTIGVLIVYLLLGIFMGYLERTRFQSRSLMFAVFYLILLPVAMTFHRIDLGNPIFWPLLMAFVGSGLYILINSLSKRKLTHRWED